MLVDVRVMKQLAAEHLELRRANKQNKLLTLEAATAANSKANALEHSGCDA